jgi:gentisate 1,2-dioxygenase
MKPILERMRDSDEIDPRHGARIRYANPLTGGWATPIMGPHLSLLPKGFNGKPYRSTDGTIFACVEGEGTTTIDGKDFSWKAGDVFVAPSWKSYAHKTGGEAVLFGISDRPAQEALGIWREDV